MSLCMQPSKPLWFHTQVMPRIEALYFQERLHTVFFVMACSQLLYIDQLSDCLGEMYYLKHLHWWSSGGIAKRLGSLTQIWN